MNTKEHETTDDDLIEFSARMVCDVEKFKSDNPQWFNRFEEPERWRKKFSILGLFDADITVTKYNDSDNPAIWTKIWRSGFCIQIKRFKLSASIYRHIEKTDEDKCRELLRTLT